MSCVFNDDIGNCFNVLGLNVFCFVNILFWVVNKLIVRYVLILKIWFVKFYIINK